MLELLTPPVSLDAIFLKAVQPLEVFAVQPTLEAVAVQLPPLPVLVVQVLADAIHVRESDERGREHRLLLESHHDLGGTETFNLPPIHLAFEFTAILLGL